MKSENKIYLIKKLKLKQKFIMTLLKINVIDRVT